MTKAYSLLSVIAIGTLLALAGLGGYLFGTGQLTPDRVDQLAGVMRGEYDPEPEDPDAPTTQPADGMADGGPSGTSAAEVRGQRLQVHMKSLRLRRAKQDIATRQRLLDHALQTLIRETEQLGAEQRDWEQRRNKLAAKSRDEGFERELALVIALPSKQAKDHIVQTWKKHPADAVRLLNAMTVQQSKKVLEQMKTPEEMRVLHDLLEQIRLQTQERSAASGKTAGASTP